VPLVCDGGAFGRDVALIVGCWRHATMWDPEVSTEASVVRDSSRRRSPLVQDGDPTPSPRSVFEIILAGGALPLDPL
jgi:hypothetical protein